MMTAPTLDAEPACPEPVEATDRPAAASAGATAPALRAERRSFAEIPRETWDALGADHEPGETPSRWLAASGDPATIDWLLAAG